MRLLQAAQRPPTKALPLSPAYIAGAGGALLLPLPTCPEESGLAGQARAE